jgi:hypothetical protein
MGVITDGTSYLQSTRFDGTATNYNLAIQPNGGNVGIGTTTPGASYKLDIVNAGAVSTRVANTASSAEASYVATNSVGSTIFGINSVGSFIYTAAAVPILFYNNNTEKMRISAAGGVSIGTSTDAGASNLLITGAAKLTSGSFTTALQGSASASASVTYTLPVAGPAVNGYVLTATTAGVMSWAAAAAGTVTSVGFTGGIISVATPTTTPAFTIAGTSGGIPYFSSGTTWATSAALAANAIVVGGGAGVAPATVTTGTGVVTALGINTGTAGAFVVNGGVLGTPSSGTVTNLTGTASININGTVGATTPSTGAFTTATASTSVTSPIVNGGSGAASSLTLQSTSGAGTSDYIAFNTASQSERMRIDTSGRFGFGTSTTNAFTTFTAPTTSAAAWTTSGINLVQKAATFTDTTSAAGTVADIRMNQFDAQTLAATNAITVTNLYGAYFTAPVAGTNVTGTAISAIGADSIRVTGGTSLVASGGNFAQIATGTTTGQLVLGNASMTGAITLGQSTVSQTTNIQAGVTASGSTKTINIGTGAASGATSTIAVGSTTLGATQTTTINGRVTLAPIGASVAAWGTGGVALVQSAATFTDTTSTGTVADVRMNVFGAQTLAASNVITATIVYGTYFTDPVAGTNVTTTTRYALGADGMRISNAAVIGGPLTPQGAVTMSTATGTIAIGTSQTTGLLTLGNTAGTGTITLGQSTVSQTTNIQAGATASGSTKTINIGTAGLSGSTTAISIGSSVSGATGTLGIYGSLTSSDLVDAVGYKGMPQNSQTASYTLALSDMGKMINITTGGVIIPANGSVAFPIGSTVIIYNNSSSSQTISITTDTMYLAGTATTGSRTLAQRGLATVVKVAATTWVISGAGVT